jgi:hypothetical protein
MTDGGAGVPAAGVLGDESEAFSAFEGALAGSVADVAGDSLASLAGEPSLTAEPGRTMARSFSRLTFRVTIRFGLPGLGPGAEDFRLSFAGAEFLLAMIILKRAKETWGGEIGSGWEGG